MNKILIDEATVKLVLDEMRRLARLANVDHTENKGVAALEQVITLAEQPAQQDIDWKDQYEKQKRRADMWVAKYEADIGPLEKAGPVAAQQEPVAKDNSNYRLDPPWRLDPLYTTPQAQRKPLTDGQRTSLRDAFAQALTSVYVCGRVWEAWQYGTMSEDDFQPAGECEEVLDSLIEAAHNIKENT